MWEDFCEVYSPNAEKERMLKEMDLETLEMIHYKLDRVLNSLKLREPKNKSIVGMELATEIIFNVIADKKVMEDSIENEEI